MSVIFLFVCLVFGFVPYLAMLRGNSWLYSQELLLAVLMDHMRCQESNSGWSQCKANTLLVLSLRSCNVLVSHYSIYFSDRINFCELFLFPASPFTFTL